MTEVLVDNSLKRTVSIPEESNEELRSLLIKITSLYNEKKLEDILFLLPELAQFNNQFPCIYNMIIGCVFIRLGRIASGLREIAFAIRMAHDDNSRKEFLKTLAYVCVQYLDDPNGAKGCIGEYMDISRGAITTQEHYQHMWREVCELSENLEKQKFIDIKCKSFDEQVLNLNNMGDGKIIEGSFAGKCLIIVNKIHLSETLLQKWSKDKKLKSDPLKLLVEAVFQFGPEIAYKSMIKMESLINQYINSLELRKTRSFSMFKQVKSDTRNDHVGIVKGFLALSRQEFKEATEWFNQVEEPINEVSLLKCYCQVNDNVNFKLKSILNSIKGVKSNEPIKLLTMGKIYERLMDYNKWKTSYYFYLSMKSYISAAVVLPMDELYYCEYYDAILKLLIKNKYEIQVITFFYAVRTYFCLTTDYNYLYVPGLIHEFEADETTNDAIFKCLFGSGEDQLPANSSDLYLIKYWYDHYTQHKGTVPETIKYYYDLIYNFK